MALFTGLQERDPEHRLHIYSKFSIRLQQNLSVNKSYSVFLQKKKKKKKRKKKERKKERNLKGLVFRLAYQFRGYHCCSNWSTCNKFWQLEMARCSQGIHEMERGPSRLLCGSSGLPCQTTV
jgi:hypothetical protein